MNLRPLNNSIIFQFIDDTSGAKGSFTETSRSGIIIPKTTTTQKVARWGKVVAVGPQVHGVAPGEYVLIEALMWTFGAKLNETEKVWRTDDTKVLAVTDDINACYPQAL